MGPDVHWLTWQEETGFVYDARTLVKKGSFRYPGPGWGLTTHHKQVVMSDGSALIKWRNPQTYKIERQQHVHEGQTRIDRINELEYVRGEIWACVLPRDHIVRIDPLTGRVRGIAWDSYTDRLWVTGKKWPVIVEISVPKTS